MHITIDTLVYLAQCFLVFQQLLEEYNVVIIKAFHELMSRCAVGAEELRTVLASGDSFLLSDTSCTHNLIVVNRFQIQSIVDHEIQWESRHTFWANLKYMRVNLVMKYVMESTHLLEKCLKNT